MGRARERPRRALRRRNLDNAEPARSHSMKERISQSGQEKRSNQPPNAAPEGRMTRRAFLKSMAAVGLGMPAAAVLLAACGGAPQAPSGTSATAPAAGGGPAAA